MDENWKSWPHGRVNGIVVNELKSMLSQKWSMASKNLGPISLRKSNSSKDDDSSSELV
jgi:hypothetical protein